MLDIRFIYHSRSPCSLIGVLTGLSKLLVKIGTDIIIIGLCSLVDYVIM